MRNNSERIKRFGHKAKTCEAQIFAETTNAIAEE